MSKQAQGKYFSFAVGLIIVLIVRDGPAHGVTIDLDASQDNTLYEDPNGSLSNGAGPEFFAGVSGQGLIQRGLLQFDVAGEIPAGATVTSATLTLYMSREASTISDNIGLHRVQAEWGEGNSVAVGGGGGGGAGGPAAPGDATWIHRISPSDAWTSAGGDFSATASASQAVLGIGFHSWSSAQLISDTQDWLDDPNTNSGWLVQGNENFSQTSKRFDSRENLDVSHRPVLAIEYESSGGLTADFTGDGFVDSLDLAIWEAAYNVNNGGDTDADNDSDGVDFLNWQQQYTGPPGLQAVPEPACMALLWVSTVLAFGTRYRRSMGT